MSPPEVAGPAELAAVLRAGAIEVGVELDDRQAGQLMTLLGELARWNERFNLTAIRDPLDVVRKHLLDSLTLEPWLQGSRIADVGTGAGFPGLPLAVVNPQRQFALIESTAKKARFVEYAASRLGLANVEVVNSRVESFEPRLPFDCVVCRAVGRLADLTRLAGHLCGPDGRVLAMKGRYPREELDDLPRGWRLVGVHPVKVPGLDAERHIVELART